jgi:serine/threonine protein kinase
MQGLEKYGMPSWSIVSEISVSPDEQLYEVFNDISNRKGVLRISSIPTEAELAFMKENMDEQEAEKCLEHLVEEKKRVIGLQEEFVLEDTIANIEYSEVRKKEDGYGYEAITRKEDLETLDSLKERKKIELREAVKIGVNICTALDVMYQRRVMHRDVKPSKILVDSEGSFQLDDFSTAIEVVRDGSVMDCVTDGLMVGTIGYMAPEILNREKYDFSVDVYSLGVVLRDLLSDQWSSLHDEMKTILWKSTCARETRFNNPSEMLRYLVLYSAALKSSHPIEDRRAVAKPSEDAEKPLHQDKRPITGVRDGGELIGENANKTIDEHSIITSYLKKDKTETK